MAAVPGIDSYPDPPPRGPLAIRGQVRMRSGENDAVVVGITIGPGTFGDAPGNTFLGNATSALDPVRPWDWDTFAGVGLTYNVSALGANFVNLIGRDGQAWSTAATSQVWIYPPDLALETLLVVVVNTGGLTTLSTPTGWTLEGSQATSASRLSVYSRVIDGTENPTETFTLGTAAGGLVQTWVFDRAHGDVEVVAAVNDNPAGTSLDIGSISPTWAGGGATNNYYIAVLGLDTESGTTVSAFPTSYTPTGQDSIASATASINARIAFADRAVLGTSEDPSAFTYGAARAAGFIIAVRGKDAGQLNATGGGAAGWDDVLLNDAHSGASNPIVDDAQYMQFGIAAPPATGQIRTNEPFELRGDKNVQIRSGEEIHLLSVDSSDWIVSGGSLLLQSDLGLDLISTDLNIEIEAFTNIEQRAGGFISIIPQGALFLGSATDTDTVAINAAGTVDVNSVGDVVNVSGTTGVNVISSAAEINLDASTFVGITGGFLRFIEKAASTPSMAAGQALFWVKNDAPNNPFFTDDTNTDRQIATFPVPTAALANITAKSVLANATNATAAVTALAGSVANTYLRVNAGNTALEFGALPAVGWDDVLAVDATSGANNPIVSVGQFIQFGLVGPTTGAPQLRSGDATFRMRGSGQVIITGDTNAALNSEGAAGVAAMSAFGAGGSVSVGAMNTTGTASILTNSVGRLTINSSGEWTAPSGGVAGTVLHWTSGAPPTWATVALSELTAVAANTYIANATAGVAAPTAVAVSAESIPARTSGNLTQLTSSAQSILLRAAGSLFFATAAADQVLRRSGSGDLGFGTLVTNNIGDDQVTNAKLATMVARSVKVNATNATANPTDLQSSAALQYLRSNSGNTGLELATLSAHGSTSVTYTSDQFQRAALTGEVTAPANNNATTVVRSTDFDTSPWSGPHRFTGLHILVGQTLFRNRLDQTLAANANDVNVSGVNVYRVQANGFALTGMQAVNDGQIIWIQNSDSVDSLFIEHLSTASSAGNRIKCPMGRTYVLPPLSSVWARYDIDDDEWFLGANGAHEDTHDFTVISLRDDFTGGTEVGSGTMGETGWAVETTNDAGNDIQHVASEINHPGILGLITAPLTNAICSMVRFGDISGGVAQSSPIIDAAQMNEMVWIVKTPAVITNVRLALGLMQDSLGATLTGGTGCITAHFDPALSNAWRLRTRTSSVDTFTTSGVVVTASTWYMLRLRKVLSGGFSLEVGSAGAISAAVTSVTNIPIALLQIAAAVQSTNTTPKTLAVDLWSLYGRDLNRF